MVLVLAIALETSAAPAYHTHSNKTEGRSADAFKPWMVGLSLGLIQDLGNERFRHYQSELIDDDEAFIGQAGRLNAYKFVQAGRHLTQAIGGEMIYAQASNSESYSGGELKVSGKSFSLGPFYRFAVRSFAPWHLFFDAAVVFTVLNEVELSSPTGSKTYKDEQGLWQRFAVGAYYLISSSFTVEASYSGTILHASGAVESPRGLYIGGSYAL